MCHYLSPLLPTQLDLPVESYNGTDFELQMEHMPLQILLRSRSTGPQSKFAHVDPKNASPICVLNSMGKF